MKYVKAALWEAAKIFYYCCAGVGMVVYAEVFWKLITKKIGNKEVTD